MSINGNTSEALTPFSVLPPDVFCKLEFLERILRSRAITLDSKPPMNHWPMSMVMKDAHAEFDVTLPNDDYILGTYDKDGVLNAWLYGSDRITVKDNIIDETDFTILFRWLGIPEDLMQRLAAMHLNYEWLTAEMDKLNSEATELVKNVGYPDWQYFVDNYQTIELYRALSPEQNDQVVLNFVNYMVQKLADPNLLWKQDVIQIILRDASAQISDLIKTRFDK